MSTASKASLGSTYHDASQTQDGLLVFFNHTNITTVLNLIPIALRSPELSSHCLESMHV